MDRDTIIALTMMVRVYRELRNRGICDVPIELKGIKAKALAARANLDRINRAYDKFNEDAPSHAAEVESMAAQVDELNSDLSFATNLLGNSVSEETTTATQSAGSTASSEPAQT